VGQTDTGSEVLADVWAGEKGRHWLVRLFRHGSGSTHGAISLTNYCCERGHSGARLTLIRIFEELRSTTTAAPMRFSATRRGVACRARCRNGGSLCAAKLCSGRGPQVRLVSRGRADHTAQLYHDHKGCPPCSPPDRPIPPPARSGCDPCSHALLNGFQALDPTNFMADNHRQMSGWNR